MENILKSVSIFNGISDESKQKIKKLITPPVIYRQNEKIIRAGQSIKEVCIILDGLIRCEEVAYNEKQLDVFYFSTGVTFPFYMLFGGESVHTFNAYAVKKTKVLWLKWEDLEPIIKEDSKFLFNILTFIAEYTCYSKMIARCIEYKKVSERIAYWLLHLTRDSEAIYVPMSQEILSDILKVNRSSLNQELVNLQKLNVIEIKNKEIKILDRIYLEEML